MQLRDGLRDMSGQNDQILRDKTSQGFTASLIGHIACTEQSNLNVLN